MTATDTPNAAGDATATGTGSPITVGDVLSPQELHGGDNYTFTVVATNCVGSSVSSSPPVMNEA